MRITGMATGLDMDKIIKDSMKPYRIKVDQMTQKKDVVEIKQKLYRDIIKDNRDFFNKHLDIVKSDSLLKESNWSAVSFSSSNENAVTAKASGGAIKDNYTVSVEQLAAKATTTLLDGATGEQTLTINDGKSTEIKFLVEKGKSTAKENAKVTIDNFNKAVKEFKEKNTNLTSEQLKPLNITAKYSEISGGIVFEAKDFEQGGFKIAGKAVTATLPDGIANDSEQILKTISGVPEIKFKVVNDVNKTAKENAEATIANFNKAIEDKKKDTSLTAEQLNSLNITAKYSEISKGIIFEAKDFGQGGFEIAGVTNKAKDEPLIATISNSKGETFSIVDKYTNTVTVDGITFTFNQKTTTDVTLTGKTDAKELKDKIVGFVNDYNKLIEKMNTTVSTKHDRSYNPLTAEQKKDMSESEVKLWNERVDKGQLYRDSDVTRIANSMKDSMRTLMEGSGLNLEKIGIKPVKDYSGTLNGTFTIDEDKLTKALENNTEDVMKLFTTKYPTEEELAGLPTEQEKIKRKSQTGILFKLKDTLDVEFRKSTSSPLLKKAGFEGTSTFSTNELSKNITNYEKKIKDMEKSFSRREQALYSKYATLEKMMNKLNSQQSNLMSQLGMS